VVVPLSWGVDVYDFFFYLYTHRDIDIEKPRELCLTDLDMAGSLFKSPVGFALSICLFFIALVRADQNTAPASATYLYPLQNVTISLTAAKDTGDIYFVTSAPAGYDWFSFGLGDQMKGGIMFVMYSTTNQTCKSTRYLSTKADLSSGCYVSSKRQWQL
jgi:hypothetical protein